ncbi:D-alanyl-D-alanine carboxypeptidase [Myxacorys almedinensis]|uniref:D-alanyl-D-alanine carboxypeptidase n=1 Tax=Myxacorys almedinensis A TaxID=2690445 RepID=A0A8J7Z5Y6_9CYAN|nr:D-alanyl-D-alanine carboxypeptidase [Myxacorys almedinensis]NDJ18698.1 D-alanyl-D-alanine carboxypeptidase [Myxacorys almedinensis A]
MPNVSELRNQNRLLLSLLAGLLLTATGCDDKPSATTVNAPDPQGAVSKLVVPPVVQSPLAVASGNPDPQTTATIEQYLGKLADQGFSGQAQGVWMQSGSTLLANHQGTTPLPAASLTKVATSLAALQTFGVDHRFETLVGTNGSVDNGVVNGDLIIVGNNNPLFVWEEAIAVGNLLNQMQIKQVTGNLIVVGQFFMNFELDQAKAGALLKQSLDSRTWSGEVVEQHQTLPAGTAKPTLAIAGTVQVASEPPNTFKPLLKHQSLPLAELLKRMNRYSNNLMAEIVASSVGGAKIVSYKAAQAAGVPQAEVVLVNGSGLAVENRISPRAVCSMFLAIERYLEPKSLNIADIFAVVGQDTGILETRNLPAQTVTKSGSLNAVSALAGAFPTREQGVVWFVVMNGGGENLDGFRAEQEALLRSLVSRWGVAQAAPSKLVANRDREKLTSIIEQVNQL